MVSVLFTVSVEALLPPMVNDLQAAELLMVGCLVLVKFASPIIASTVAEGTPADQLAEFVHEVLYRPVQLVCALAVTVIAKTIKILKRVLINLLEIRFCLYIGLFFLGSVPLVE